jgi:hypothetical protein
MRHSLAGRQGFHRQEVRRLNDRAVSPLEPGALLGPYRMVSSLVLLEGVAGLGPAK